MYMGKIISSKAVTVLAAIIAVVALAVGPFIVSSSNLVQSAYARQPGDDFDYCYNYTLADGNTGFECVFHQDNKTSKTTCERGREAFLAANPGATASKCKLVN
jgi:hypothetical protein